MKKLLALWLGIAMTLGLTACSGGAASSAAPSAASSEAAPASSAAEEASSAASEQEEPSSAAAEPESGESQAAEETAEGGRTLVVYFSATGNTEEAAGYIASLTGGDLFELEPAQPYTSDDLNYGNEDSRVSREHADESLRDVELVADTVENWEDYDTVFLGYPKIQVFFLPKREKGAESMQNVEGKVVIITGASSGIGEETARVLVRGQVRKGKTA